MNREFVDYNTALELKELGFNEHCFGEWQNLKTGKNLVVDEEDRIYDVSVLGADIKAPLYQQAFRWFREKYQLHSTITSISQESWQWHITKPSESLGKLYDEDFYTYEEAELACLKKLIEIVKTK